MLTQSIKRSLITAALAMVLVALTAMTGSSTAAAQDDYYRGRKFGRDGRVADYFDNLLQKREKRLWSEDLKREKQFLRREQQEKRRLSLNFKRQERQELMQRKRLEMDRKRIEKERLKQPLKSRVWRLR